MLPRGAVHLPCQPDVPATLKILLINLDKGIAKVAKALAISYAEACTGFEFKKQRAIPVITGVVVAAENEEFVMEVRVVLGLWMKLTNQAYWESSAAAEEKERVKNEEKALKRWVKLVNGLRVRARLLAAYGSGEHVRDSSRFQLDMLKTQLHDQQDNPLSEKGEGKSGRKTAASILAQTHDESLTTWAEGVGFRESSPSARPGASPEEKPEVLEEPLVVENGASPSTATSKSEDEVEVFSVKNVEDNTPDSLDSNGKPPRKRRQAPREPESAPPPAEGRRQKAKDTARRKSGRKSGSKKLPTPPPSARSLRSRGQKTEGQVKEERAKRAKLRAALRSGSEGSEEE